MTLRLVEHREGGSIPPRITDEQALLLGRAAERFFRTNTMSGGQTVAGSLAERAEWMRDARIPTSWLEFLVNDFDQMESVWLQVVAQGVEGKAHKTGPNLREAQAEFFGADTEEGR